MSGPRSTLDGAGARACLWLELLTSGRDADPGAVPLVPGAATARERDGAVVVTLPVITVPLRLAAGKGRQKAHPNYFPFQIAYYRCSILFGHDPLRQWF